jgi:hypothetical protein
LLWILIYHRADGGDPAGRCVRKSFRADNPDDLSVSFAELGEWQLCYDALSSLNVENELLFAFRERLFSGSPITRYCSCYRQFSFKSHEGEAAKAFEAISLSVSDQV